jgi:muconate cycloisomerase
MRICRAEAFLVDLPFRLTFRHALASRNMTSNLIVRFEDETGCEGWGEGLPRKYVTGEEPPRSFRELTESILPGLAGLEWERGEDVPLLLEKYFMPSPGTQSAWCAAELAFLDLAGRLSGRSAASWFGGPARETLRYGGVVPLLREGLEPFLLRLREAGLEHVKVKAGREGFLDTVTAVRAAFGETVTIAVDANGSWNLEEALAACRALEPLNVSWIEQPLPRGDERNLARLAAGSAIPLMADESLTTEEEARSLARSGSCAFFNLRISKLGGLGPARRVASVAAEAGIGVQVGCQVGESAILSAAGRILAATLDDVAALEGSYGTLLLEEDLATEPFSFGPGGKARLQKGAGLGISINHGQVKKHATQHHILDY